ncbi:MAG: aspartate aminotransferase family protein [Gammaproteobacteria bacterium]|nr:aspartate aminotransferase family protein [Gammaproteobacteria bacterium]
MTDTETDTTDLLSRRARALGPTYTLFYDEPLHIVRAEGVWMYDAEGRRYLDAYNNVPVVGHCHPHVVEELARQARTLNTHTRYLAEQPLELAEKLLATMPRDIGNVVYTCTGSEANDLAARISKTVTGGTGFIITDYAYHGATDTIAGMSPEDGAPLGPGVYAVPAPLGTEGAAKFADRVRQCIDLMQAANVKPAALLVDTIFSSDGVVSHPTGFLAEAAAHIRAAGGLFIADEVQPGFGRTGDHMWGFARHGVVPDIVTMGKPMGNGHPVAALAARPELLEAFARHTRYFNTFGGNSVSCAVALAVLHVIEKENLVANARAMGEYLQQGLRKLAQRYSWIREVRGAGLFLGVDLAANPAARLTARQEATRIINDLSRQGVLVGSTGRDSNVLKIRPPLTMVRAEADFLIDALEGSFRAEA